MSEKSGWTKPVLPSSKSSSPQTLPKSEKSTRRKTLLGFENNGVEFASLEATLQDAAFNGNILSGLKPESEPSISTKIIEKEPALSGRMPISLKNSKIQSDFVADVMKFYTSDYQCFEGDFNSTSVFKETSDHDPETTHVEEHLTDECHLDRKKIDRHNLFNLFPMPKEICVSKFTDSSNPGQPIGCDGTGLRFMITPTKLEFEHNALEPLFCTLALYNFDTGQKLCEDFWFHVNKPDVHRLLPKSLERNYSPLQSCVFNVALPHPAVHFVVCVYKSAGPCDRDDAAEAYVKGATMSDKSRAKWTNDAQDWAQRFGSYRQPLAWGASPVFTDRGELVGSARSATMAVSPLLRWRAGQSPHTALSVDVLRRARVLPGAQLVCQRTSLSETSAKQVLRHAEKTALAVAQSGGGGGNVTRYAAPFNPPSIGLAPHVEPVHELYVYLSSADLSSTSGRNVLCEITLRRSDDAPLPAPSRPPPDADGPFVSITGVRRAYFQSTLTYHQKKPTYFSECKLLLPVDLGPRAHLVFTFYHVPLPKKTGKKTEDVTPLAVATLPFMQDGAWMVRDGEANLSLAATLPPHYLDAEQQEHIKWLDSGKPLFSLRTRLLSSIVPVGDALQRTLALGYTGRGAMVGTASAALSMGGPPPPLMAAKRSPITSDSIDAALQACGMLSRASVLQWMPHIFARLFTIIQSSSASTEQQRQALIALLDSATTAQKASQPQRATAAWRERTLQDIDLDELSKPPVSPRRTGSHVSQLSMREEEDSADRDVKLEARAWRRHSARQNPLTAYVAFTFGCSESDATLHEPLARAWSNALRARGTGGSGFQTRQSSSPAISPLPSPLHSDSSSLDHRSSPNVRAQVTAPRFSKATLTHCDFLFTLLLKSLLMHDAAERTARQQQQQTTGVRVGSNRWNEAMQRLVARLGKRLSDADASGYGLIVEEAVIATARFIRRALCVMDRGVVLNAAELFLAELAPTPQLTAADAGAVDTAQLQRRFMYRVQFVRIVCDQRQYPSIAMPRLVKLDHSVAHTLARHARRHYVAALAVYAATSALRCDESVVREPAIAQLLTLLWRHDNDARLRGRTRLSLVASLYFPLLPALLDAFDSMRATASRRELALWLLAAFWLLRNLRVATLQQWMLRETQTRRRRLFDLLTLGITLFDPNTSSGTIIGKSESEEYRRRRSSGEFSSTSDTLAALKNAASAADSPQAAVDVIVSAAPAANNSISSASPARLSRRRRSRDLTNTPETPFIPTSTSLTPFFKKTQRESPWLSVEDRMESNDESSVSNVVASRSDVESYHSAMSGVVPAAKRTTGGGGGGVDALARTASSDHATHSKGESLSMSDTTTDAPKKVNSFRAATPKSRRASAVPRLGSGRRAAELVSFDFWPLALGRSLSCDVTVELGLTALDVTMAFVQRFERQLLGGTTDSDDLFERVFGVLLAVARRADAVRAPQFARVAMATLTTTLERFRAPLFGLSNTVSGELCDVLVRQCNAEQRPINEQGVAALFFVLQQNYAAVGNVSRTRLQTTIAVTRLLGGASTRSATVHASALRRAFGSIVELAEVEVSAQRSGTSSHEAAVAVASEAEALAGVIASLIRDTSKITAVRQVNAAATADLLHSVSRDMWAAPDLRLAWLLNLAQYQRDGKRFEEAAQTRITCAVLVAEYLKLLGRFGDAMAAANARQLCPSVDSELAVMPQAVELAPVRDDICQSKMFSEDGFVALLMEAIELLKLGGLHESCVASYQMVLPIHSRRGDYQKQREAYEDLARQCAHITEAASHNETLRQFSKYYRVAFFGKAFGALHNTEYVYKQSSFTRVMDMSSALKRHHPSVEFELLPNKIDARQHLDTDKKAYIQLVAVEPHFNPDELTNRPTTFEQNFNLLRFRYETPFTKSGKSHGEIKDQWKRKTILTVEAPFPHMRHRLKVVETEENDVAPIESAIEQLERKTFTLMAEVKAARPQAKQLQMHLQGSLLTAVNAGPFAICEAFLSPKERGSHSTSDADKLYETMCGLERALGEAVRLNANLIAGEQVELQAALEEGYAVFCETLRQYATETESVIASLTVAPRTDATAGDLSTQLVQADAAATRDADALKLATAGDAANALAAHNSALLDAAPSSAVTRLHASARSQPPVVPPRPRSPPPPPLPADQADFSTSTPPGTPPLPRRRTSDRPPTPPLPDDPPAPPLPPNSVTTAHDDVVNSKMQAIKTSMFGLLNELNGRVQRAADSINDNSTPPRALLMLGSQLKNARPTLESAAASLGTLLPPTPESLVQGRPGDDAAAKLARLRALLLHSLDEVTLLSNAARRATEAVDAPADLPPLANVVRQLHDLLGD